MLPRTLALIFITGSSSLYAMNVSSQVFPPINLVGNETVSNNSPIVLRGSPFSVPDSKRMASWAWHHSSPLGYYVEPGQSFNYYIDCTNHKDKIYPYIQVGTYSRYKGTTPLRRAVVQNVHNTLTSGQNGGILYAQAAMMEYNADASCNLTIEGANPMPRYQLGTTTKAAWRAMLDNYPAPDVILESERAIIVASRENALRYLEEDQDKVLQAIDKVINAEDKIAMLQDDPTLFSSNSKSLHKILMTETDNPDVFMIATDYHTAYHKDTMGHLLSLKGFANDGWGPWHELGHMHQQNLWRWDGINEVQVNIFTLAAERAMGIYPSRWMKETDSWGRAKKYLNKTSSEKDYNLDKELGNEGKLMMFHQLWLAYGDVFYQSLHRYYRATQPVLATDEEKINSFILRASIYSGHNLASFFSTWGLMPKDPNAYNSLMAKLNAFGLPPTKIDPYTLTDQAD